MKALFPNKFFLILVAPVVYLIVSILTLSDYGINWDSPKHFIRGQSYLHFILTGKRDFLDFPAYPKPKGAPDYVDVNVSYAASSSIVNSDVRRSYFQSDFYTFDYFLTKHEHTHPEVNDLLIATSNYIFFQQLGLIGDIEAYHLFVVIVVFALMAAIAFWVYYHFGLFASIVSSTSLVLYPLVFAESHFNIKDPILMSFFGLAILTFSLGFSSKKLIWILFSALFTGLSLGIKFNTIFLPIILGPWLLIFFKKVKRIDKMLFLGLLFYPVISLGVFYLLSPYLWNNPIEKFIAIVKYYQSIGVGTPSDVSSYLIDGWNTYPIVWIFLTTPLPILILSIIGFLYSVYLVTSKGKDYMLIVLLWFLVPIARVVWQGANIYGGVRQIMEFIPAMAILSGVGVYYLYKIWPLKIVIPLAILSLILVSMELKNYHPYQNVYFNQIIGGLKGAQQKNIPSWGNSYGSVYLQGINWLNQNAEVDAKLALPINYISAIPRIKLRQDISLDNSYFSGMNRQGEYAMELSYDWSLKSRYKYSYYDIFLEPVYQVKVDDVVLLKIWKNDFEYTKKGFEEESLITPKAVTIEQQKLKIDFIDQVFLTKLVIDHSTDGCEARFEEGFISVSKDGVNLTREPGALYDPESPEISQGMDQDSFVYLFSAKPAVSIVINPQIANACILKDYQVTVWGLER